MSHVVMMSCKLQTQVPYISRRAFRRVVAEKHDWLEGTCKILAASDAPPPQYQRTADIAFNALYFES